MLEDIGTVFYSGPPAGAKAPRMRGVINVEAPSTGEGIIIVQIGSLMAEHAPAEDPGILQPCAIDASMATLTRYEHCGFFGNLLLTRCKSSHKKSGAFSMTWA